MTPRFHCPLPLAAGATIELPEGAAHHALRVLRLKPGDPVTLFNGEGGEYAATLERADTRGIEPMAHPLEGLAQRLRADEVLESDRHADYQRNAPQVEAGLYLVPKVIE